jgi:hypothetical protein
MTSECSDGSILEDEDVIGVTNGGKTVRDDEGGSPDHEPL